MRADLTTGEGDVWRRACEAMRAACAETCKARARLHGPDDGGPNSMRDEAKDCAADILCLPIPDPPPDVAAGGWDYRG